LRGPQATARIVGAATMDDRCWRPDGSYGRGRPPPERVAELARRVVGLRIPHHIDRQDTRTAHSRGPACCRPFADSAERSNLFGPRDPPEVDSTRARDVTVPSSGVLCEMSEELRSRDCLFYLFGSRCAIQKLVRCRQAFWLGALFVLLAGVCREYDQEYLGDNPIPYLLPFVVSVILCAVIRVLAVPYFRESLNPNGLGSFRTFLTLFWLTAPCAWILAIPVEEMLDPVAALKVNLALLAVVSIWRVWLFDRVIKVLTGTHIVWPVLALGMPVFVVASVLSQLSLVGIMTGGSRTEEQAILLAVSRFVGVSALYLTVPAWVLYAVFWRRAKPYASFESARDVTYSWGIKTVCPVLLVGAMAMAVPAQVRLRRLVHFQELVADGRPGEAVAYANQFAERQFPVTRRIYPPRTYWGLDDAMAIFSQIEGDEKDWLKRDVETWLSRALAPGSYGGMTVDMLQACPVSPYHISVLEPHKEEIERHLERFENRESIKAWIDALGLRKGDE